MESKSIKELKSIIKAGGLSFADCFEKSELVERAKQAQERIDQSSQNQDTTAAATATGTAPPAPAPVPPPAQSSSSASHVVQKYGKFECIVKGLGSGKPVDGVVIILHGFGATNDNFVPLAGFLGNDPTVKEKNVVYVFPQAHPSPKAMGSTAWWDIDVMKWMGAMQGGEAGIAQLIREKPTGLDECRQDLITLLNDLKKTLESEHEENKTKEYPLILGGFSQGAMTACDLALHLPNEHKVKHVMMFSGAPIVVDEWAEKLKSNDKGKSMKALITHGRSDMVLPFAASGWVKDLLASNGVQVDYEAHAGAHELGGPAVLSKISTFLASALESSN